MKSIFLLTCLLAGTYAQETAEIACSDLRPAYLESSEAGIIYQVGYNENATYLDNMLCEWHIHDDGNQGIEISSLDFNVEFCEDCYKCDYVEVWEGSDDTGELLGLFCGYENFDPILVESGDVFIRFVSDDSHGFRGFVIRYGFPLDSNACDADRPHNVTHTDGVFFTPTYPGDYLNNMICHWLFFAPPGQRVEIGFFDFEVEGGCNLWDTLTVFDGDSISSPRVGRWYGGGGSSEPTIPPAIISSGNTLFVTFTTDSSVVFKGFFGYYRHLGDDDIKTIAA